MREFKWLLFFLVLAGCKAMGTSNNTNVTLDLSTDHTDERFTVRGRQIYYDLGLEPSRAGTVSVKINSTQATPVTLAPGGSIMFDGVIDIFVSNVAQVGKSMTLLINENSTINNNPTNPLSAGIPSNRYALGAPNTTGFTLPFDQIAGAGFTSFVIYPPNQFPPNGYLIKRLTLAAVMADYRDVAYVYLDDGLGNLFYLLNLKNGVDSIENVFVPPQYGLSFFMGGQFGVVFLGNAAATLSGLVSAL